MTTVRKATAVLAASGDDRVTGADASRDELRPPREATQRPMPLDWRGANKKGGPERWGRQGSARQEWRRTGLRAAILPASGDESEVTYIDQSIA